MKKIIFLTAVIFWAGFISCSKKKRIIPTQPPYILENLQSFPFYADSLIFGDIDSLKIKRIDTVTVIRPDQAKAKLGEKAEHYLTYQMIGMVKTKYKIGSDIVDVKVIQFADKSDAYGFYAGLRPDGVVTRKLGAESFNGGDTTYITQGAYVVLLFPEKENKKNDEEINIIWKQMAQKIYANHMLPSYFMLFPYRGRIMPSAKYFPYHFLKIPNFREVYTTDYLNKKNGDTLTLLLTMDKKGIKFISLRQYAQSLGTVIPTPRAFSFAKDSSIAFKYPEKGIIVAGVVRKKLIGIIGYNANTDEMLIENWIQGLQ
ncbi:MAG: hypothetical protein GXO93_03740 [FCB group bacterium]|nr:hypothetical protein [FCB group bacterium]